MRTERQRGLVAAIIILIIILMMGYVELKAETKGGLVFRNDGSTEYCTTTCVNNVCTTTCW